MDEELPRSLGDLEELVKQLRWHNWEVLDEVSGEVLEEASEERRDQNQEEPEADHRHSQQVSVVVHRNQEEVHRYTREDLPIPTAETAQNPAKSHPHPETPPYKSGTFLHRPAD